MRKPEPTFEALFPPVERYTYFAPHAGGPAAGARFLGRVAPPAPRVDPLAASWLADAALLAYAPEAFARERFRNAGLTLEFVEDANGSQCCLAHDDAVVIVAFRGTQVPRPEILGPRAFAAVVRGIAEDLLTDAHFWLADVGGGRYVHGGILQAFRAIWERPGDGVAARLARLRQQRPGRTVWLTGHSLGAALATLAADRLPDAAGLYTYGSPHVGDGAFVRGIRVPAARFVHGNDPVTKIAPVAPFEHPPRLLRPLAVLAHVGTLRQLGAPRPGADALRARLPRLVADLRAGPFRPFVSVGESLRGAILGFVVDSPADDLMDHAPIHYATALWNALEP
jgi:triacylglycerol lipase